MAKGKPVKPGAPVLPSVLRPKSSPYRQNTVTADGGGGGVAEVTEPVRTETAGPTKAGRSGGQVKRAGQGSAQGAKQKTDPADLSAPQATAENRARKSAKHGTAAAPALDLDGPLKISTRIPLVPVLETRLALIMQDYGLTAGEARPLALKPVFARLRQISETGDIPDLRFVRVPRDLAKIPTTISLPREIFAALSARVDPHNALSRSAVLESMLFQILAQMEADGELP